MNEMSLRTFLSDVELARLVLREADAVKAKGDEATRPDLFAEAARLIDRVFGPELEEARDWLARPLRDALDVKIAAMQPQRTRLAA